jgi:hypothetical protein
MSDSPIKLLFDAGFRPKKYFPQSNMWCLKGFSFCDTHPSRFSVKGVSCSRDGPTWRNSEYPCSSEGLTTEEFLQLLLDMPSSSDTELNKEFLLRSKNASINELSTALANLCTKKLGVTVTEDDIKKNIVLEKMVPRNPYTLAFKLENVMSIMEKYLSKTIEDNTNLPSDVCNIVKDFFVKKFVF